MAEPGDATARDLDGGLAPKGLVCVDISVWTDKSAPLAEDL
jgi:hypothetical protein